MSLDAAWALRWIELAAADVAEQRDYLVDLDRAIGDGDHGENMDRGFKAAVEALGQAQPGSVAEVLKTVAKTLMSTVGGAPGPCTGRRSCAHRRPPVTVNSTARAWQR